jgi:toxin-antitoxin system PIN domain toxin
MPASGAIKLPDANIWLALAFSDHAHHQKAASWFDQQPDFSCAFCRITQLALLRLLTNSQVMGPFVQTQKGAWSTFDSYTRDPRVAFCDEPTGLDAAFRNLSGADSPSHSLWTDCYLAPFAAKCGLTLATFDHGFGRFSSLSLEILS